MTRPWNYARVERNCKQCGIAFSCSPSRTQQHCSDACSRITQATTRSKPIVTRVCVACGKEFQQPQLSRVRSTCSDACIGLLRTGVAPGNKLPRKTLACKQCGGDFAVSETSKRIFCSKDCADSNRRGVPTGRLLVKIQCRECAVEFEVTPARKPTALYCSLPCANAAMTRVTGAEHPLYKEKDTRSCEQCGEDFEARAAGDKRFCSRQCVGAYTTQLQGGRRSSIELLVEAELLRLGIVAEHSKPVGQWVVDFLLVDKKTVIECDGSYWHSIPEVAARDLRKDEWLGRNGYQVIRIGEVDIRRDVSEAVGRCTIGLI